MENINRNDGLTDEEGKIMDSLVDAWNKYIELPVQLKCETKEFAEGIAKCQMLLSLRIARRHYPEGWPVDNEC